MSIPESPEISPVATYSSVIVFRTRTDPLGWGGTEVDEERPA